MLHKKILVINGHPTANSYCQALAETYQQSAINAGHEAELLNLYALSFDPNFKWGYSKKETPVADVLMAQEKIKDRKSVV